MNIMYLKIFCFVIAVFVCSCTSSGKKLDIASQNISEAQESVPTEKDGSTRVPQFDVTKKYVKKEIVLNDIAEITYIPMESTNDVLLTNSIGSVSYISNDLMVMVNRKAGDCFLFDGKGKIKSKFNHRGNSGSEYVWLGEVAVDEKNKEIYILDDLRLHRILVYSFEGKYKRTLPLPQKMIIGALLDFDAENLLCNDESPENKYPYALLSKSTGKITRILDMSFDNRIPLRFVKQIDEHTTMPVKLSFNAIIRNNEKYIIGELSSDTIYSYSGSKVKTPLMTRIPSVYDMDPAIMLIPELKLADKFFFTSVKREFDFKTMKGFPEKSMIYDYRVDDFFEYTLVNKDYPAQKFSLNYAGKIGGNEKNTLYQLIPSEKLVVANMEGKVFGKLKEIAGKLEEEDNPVLMIVKFNPLNSYLGVK